VPTSRQRARPGWTATTSALVLLPPGHRTVHVRSDPARHRRRPTGNTNPVSLRTRLRPGLRRPARHRHPPASTRAGRLGRSWPGQGQRPRSRPPPAPGHHADALCRPPARLRLVPAGVGGAEPGPVTTARPAPRNIHVITCSLITTAALVSQPVRVFARPYGRFCTYSCQHSHGQENH